MTSALPLPVSALLRRARNAKSPKERHDTAYFAWEASVVLAVAARPPHDIAALARPSVGAWVTALQASEERLAEAPLAAALALFQEVGTGRRGAPKKASAREVLDALPAYRNQVIGHGSTRAADFYDPAGLALVEGLECAWAQGFFLREGERLTYVEALEIDQAGRRRARLLDLTGDVGRVVDPRGTPDVPDDVLPRRVYLRAGARWRSLHPWVLCQEDEARERVHLFGSLVHRAKYLDYVSGETLSGDALEAAFPGTEAEVAALFSDRARDRSAESPTSDPDRLGPYQILGKLGSGGMGRVVRARLTDTGAGLPAGTVVALKVVHPHLLESPGFLRRFQREAEIGRRIVHENVVRTFDADATRQDGKDVHFLVMEYVEGQTLRGLLAELGKVPEELCRHIGREVARGLSAIHAGGVVHQDVKPENVLITKEHVVKVMDLGVARVSAEEAPSSGSGWFVGSVQYAAPEQFETGQEIDGRTDLYALGATLYELCTGQKPYVDEDVHKTLKRVLYEVPRRCSEVNPQLSPFFEEVVHTLLAKKRVERFPDASELVRVLEQGEASAWWKARARAIRAATKRPLRRIRIPRETALYGRDAELARLRALYAKTRAGEGQVVVIEGEAGIGKSRLVDEFVGLLQREGEDLNFLHGSYPPGGAATVSGAFSVAYREQFGAEGLEETLKTYLAETPTLVPAFAALLRGEVPSGVEALTKDSLQTVFIRSTQALAAERPTIVLIDDLHFAPEEGRALLVALAMAVPGHRILLVGTTRPGLDERWLAHFDRIGATRLTLARLGPKDLSRLLVDALRSEHLAEELAYRIGAKSDGNPFFVFEILRGLREGQFLSQRPDGTWVTTQVIADITIPSSILELVQARVADLDDAERQMLDVAACVGFEFDPLLVAQVLGLSKIPAMQALAKIEKRHRIVRSAGRRFVFDQHQVQEACYQGLPEILREEYHALIADALEAQQGATGKDPKAVEGGLAADLAEHLFNANRGDRALAYLPAALTFRDRGCLPAAAVTLTERALAVPGLLEGSARCDLLLGHARRLDVLGRAEAEVKTLEEAKSLAGGDAGQRAKVGNELGDLFRRLARYEDARRELEEALALYRSLSDRVGEACTTVNLGAVAWHVGRFDEAFALDRCCLEIARQIGHRGHEAAAEGNLGIVCWSTGRNDEAHAHYQRSLVLYREIGDRPSEALTSANLGLAYYAQGHYGEARKHFEHALAVSRAIGYRPGEAHATACLGETCHPLGLLSEARGHFERRLALSREIGDRAGAAGALLHLGQLLWEEGEQPEGLAKMESALAECRDIRWRWDEAQALLALGSAHTQAGRTAEAHARLGEALALGKDVPFPGVELVASALMATLPGPDVEGALGTARAALLACESSSGLAEAMQARFLLWQATHDPAHLLAARQRLDHLVAHAPPECRASMLQHVRLHREIAQAAPLGGG